MILILIAIPADAMICKDMFCIHIHGHSCWCNDMQGYVLHSHTLPFLLMQTFWVDTHWMDTHWMATYWWDKYWMDTYGNDTYWQDTCVPFEWIRIEWIRIGGIRIERIRIGGIRIGGIRVEWICVGYVWGEIRQQSSDETSFGKNVWFRNLLYVHGSWHAMEQVYTTGVFWPHWLGD